MATVNKVPRSVPSAQRTVVITDVAVGDRINIDDVLGRPARGLKMITTSATDSVSYKVNNLISRHIQTDFGRSTNHVDSTDIWSGDPAFATFTDIGALIELVDGVSVSSIEITAMTLATPAVIQLVVW